MLRKAISSKFISGTSSVKVEVLDVAETVKKDEAKELYRYI